MFTRSLDRKLWRDLISMRGQALAIAAVIAGGVATMVLSMVTVHSLRLTQATFYGEHRFGDVFADLKRAPESLRARIEALPGVGRVQTRVVAPVNLDLAGYSDPVSGAVYSIPDRGQPLLNALFLREGRLVDAARPDEVIVNDAFADAHRIGPGDPLPAIINGRRRVLTVVGVAISPDHIFPIQPGSMIPDFARFGILWMARTPLGTAYDMKEAFNSVVLSLEPGVNTEEIIDQVDALLKPFGGLGAHGREDQISHRYLSEEFRQLEQMATVFPVIFLGVSAFLLNMVVSRVVRAEREQIATLKAFGYGTGTISIHYMKMIGLIVLIGVAPGSVGGAWLGHGLSVMYLEYYRFPYLLFEVPPNAVLIAALASAAAAAMGTIRSVRAAARQPPAEAMRPEPPAHYRVSLVERWGFKRWFSQSSRMMLRNLERNPLKSFLSALGIAFSVAILVMGGFFQDAVDHMITTQFGLAQRDDATVVFVEPTSRRALFELKSIRGVTHTEGFRSVPIRLRFEHRSMRTEMRGVDPDGDLFRLLDGARRKIPIPPSGILLTDYLGEILGAEPGSRVQVELLEGRRGVREVEVAGWVSEYVGVAAYMDLDALNRLSGEGNSLSGVYLATDGLEDEAIYSELKDMPRVAATTVQKNAIENLYETMGEQVLTFTFFMTMLAGAIAVGVVYNSARIALAERNHELASLRVLGFTRAEISVILLGELALLTLFAIPLGFVLGWLLSGYMISNMQTELFRIPLVVAPRTYAFAAAVVLAAGALSAWVVRRKLDRLDLVSALKARE